MDVFTRTFRVGRQTESLELHEEGTTFYTYVSGLIDGIDDPANAYWNDPNRHW